MKYPPFWDDSDISRYVSGYDRGWWWCVVQHERDIDYRANSSAYPISGWPAETYGWPAGIADAQARIEQLVRAYGKLKVSDLLSDFKDLKLNDE